MAGYHQIAGYLHQEMKNGRLQQDSNLLEEFMNSLNNLGLVDPVGNSLLLKVITGYDVLLGHTPAAVILEGTDNGTGHAISIFENYIIDSSWPFALPRTKESLDWSCYPAQFKKPSLVYILTPRPTHPNQHPHPHRHPRQHLTSRGEPPHLTSPPFGSVFIPYPQHVTTSLASSFASALHMAGNHQVADHLYSSHHNNDNGNGDLDWDPDRLNSFSNFVNNQRLVDQRGQFLMLARVKRYNMFSGPTPAAVVLETTDGFRLSISIFKDYIINSSCPVVLPRTIESLDWSCFPSAYKKPNVVFILVPRVPRSKPNKKVKHK
jgi:hypothetical protein